MSPLFIGIFCLVFVVGILATKRGLLMKFKRRPGFGSEITVALSEEGLTVGTDAAAQRLAWSIYPTSVRFKDGILLKNRVRYDGFRILQSGQATHLKQPAWPNQKRRFDSFIEPDRAATWTMQ
ncbi:MAG TPA: hypothetical protein VGC19_13870 [Rhodanobacter sp.]